MCFGIGVLLEGLGKYSTSGRLPWLTNPLSYVMDTDRVIRTKNLLDINRSGYTPAAQPQYFVKSSDILRQVFEALSGTKKFSDTVAVYCGPKLALLPGLSRLQSNPATYSGEKFDDLTHEVNQIYYISKNLVYRDPSYFEELSRIENSVTFTRTLTVAMILLSCSTLIALGIGAFRQQLIGGAAIIAYRKLVGAFFFYVAGVLLSVVAYKSESINYHLRIFGYAITTLTEPADKG